MKKISKQVLALLLAVVMVLPIGMFSANPFVTQASAASPTVTVDTGSEHYSIGETNAVLCGKVSNPNEAKVSKVGIKLYDSSDNLLKDHSESHSFTDSVVYMWFDVNSEIGYTLKKGTTYKYQVYADVGGNRYTSSKASFTTANADRAQLAIMPLKDIMVTQGAGGTYSHAGTKNVDFGKSQNLYAPFDCKVVYKDTSYEGGNSIVIESTSKVRFADGTYDYMCVLTAHDNDISDLSKGKTIKQGDVYYHTGTYGNVTGEHVHMCVAKGKYAGQYQNSSGNWELKNSILPSKAFFIDASTKISSSGGYTWKSIYTLSVYYNANGGSISSDTYYLSSDNIYKKSDSSKFCQKWTYNNAQKDGLYNATTFGLSRSGYEFVGWSTTSSGELWFDQNDTGLLPTHLNANIANGDCSVTMYAVWKKNTVTTYTLSYNANGGSGAPSSQSGATSYAVSSTEPARSGYTFLGWSTSSSATSASYVGGDTITLSSNTTLYAVWKKTECKAEFYYEGEKIFPDLTFVPGEPFEIPDEYRLSILAGHFEGWSETGDFTSMIYSPGYLAYIDNDIVLYPVFSYYSIESNAGTYFAFDEDNSYYTIEFTPETSGEYVIKTYYDDTETNTYGSLFDEDLNCLAENDDFDAENGDYNFNIKYNLVKGEKYYILLANMGDSYNGSTYLFVSRTYNLYYNANGGSDAPITQSGDSVYNIPYHIPYRDGYEFIGWATSSSDTSASYSVGNVIYLSENITLYAVWEAVDYSITVSGGTASKTSATVGETITLTANAAPAGKVFDKWVISGTTVANETSATTTFTMPANNVTATATYKDKAVTPPTPTTYTVSVTNGTASAASAVAGETITLAAEQIDGKVFSHWEVTGATVADKNAKETTFTMGNANVTAKAIYDDCDCKCHQGGIAGFFYKIVLFFQKLFGKNLVCFCEKKH